MKTYKLNSIEPTRISRFLAPDTPWIFNPEDNKALGRLERSCKTNLIETINDVGIFKGSGKKPYHTNLTGCDCRDYILHKKPCKHMIRMGIEMEEVFFGDKQVSYIKDETGKILSLDVTTGYIPPERNRLYTPKILTMYQKWFQKLQLSLTTTIITKLENEYIFQNDEGTKYHTSLDFCSCPGSIRSINICKHRIRYAIEKEMIAIDTDLQIIYTPWGDFTNTFK